ncbi:MAG: hypothetical protein WBV39_09885 [Rudaea sp.]
MDSRIVWLGAGFDDSICLHAPSYKHHAVARTPGNLMKSGHYRIGAQRDDLRCAFAGV